MSSSWDNPLRIEEIGTGEQAGTWGTTTNVNIADALPEAITGRATATFPSDADYTLPRLESNAPQVFRNLVLNVTSSGNLSATRNLIIPAINKQYFIENNTSGGQSIVVKTAAGSGVTVPNGFKAHVFCDGTNTRFADDFVDINGGTIDGTPIGAASASTGVFSTATITTATVTTGNITTGNINTLTVGTQTNKATISYTTNTARTLTIPNVGGNRTFAFLDQAQIFTADQSFDENVVIAKNCTIEDNLIFSGAGTLGYNRIVGEFGTPTLINRTYFQTIAPDTPTSVGAIPSGTAQGCSFIVNNNSTPTNASFTAIYVDDDECSLNASIHGSGTYLPLRIFNGGGGRIIVDPTGEIGMGTLPEADTTLKLAGRTHSLKADSRVRFSSAYGYTVGATNRTLFIDNTGDIGGLSSTRESKTNIASIANADWLMSLEPVSYNRRERDEDGVYTEEYNPSTEFGLIADDVANVRPEICVFVDGKVSGINYEQLIAPMLKEIQNLRAEIAALKEKVNG
jgi:hypothetical protein